jgi:hypothetical protein
MGREITKIGLQCDTRICTISYIMTFIHAHQMRFYFGEFDIHRYFVPIGAFPEYHRGDIVPTMSVNSIARLLNAHTGNWTVLDIFIFSEEPYGHYASDFKIHLTDHNVSALFNPANNTAYVVVVLQNPLRARIDIELFLIMNEIKYTTFNGRFCLEPHFQYNENTAQIMLEKWIDNIVRLTITKPTLDGGMLFPVLQPTVEFTDEKSLLAEILKINPDASCANGRALPPG